MAFFRRLMLLNIGSPTATIAALVAASLEEAISRSFLVEVDTLLRRWLRQPKLEGDELWLQRLAWMCDVNLSAIAEFTAIITSTFAQVILQRHALVLALGYPAGGGSLDACTGVVVLDIVSAFVNLMVELTLELLVDYVAMWAEAEHGIPVTEYFTHQQSLLPIVYFIAVSLGFCSLTIYSFIRAPTFATCPSSDYVCDPVCVEQYDGWYTEYCAAATNSSGAHHYNNSTFLAKDDDIFANVDPFAILIALLTGFAMLALISLSVLFARYRKKNQKVMGMIEKVNSIALREQSLRKNKDRIEEENSRLKAELDEVKKASSLEAKLTARPPRGFTPAEFEADNPGHVKAMFALCEGWILSSPVGTEKWEYFESYVVPLPMWDDTQYFIRLAIAAKSARRVVAANIRDVVAELARDDGGDGGWVCRDLVPVAPDVDVGRLAKERLARDWLADEYLAPARGLGAAAKAEYDTNVLPVLLRFIAGQCFDLFGGAMMESLPEGAFFESVAEGNGGDDEGPAATHRRRASWRPSKVSMLAAGRLMVRFERDKCVKSEVRMSAKIRAHHATLGAARAVEEWPQTIKIGDALRASIVAHSAAELRSAWERIRASPHWRVLRLKNKFRLAHLESGDSSKEGTFPELHVNVLFEGGPSPIVAEIQVHLLSVLMMKKESHRLYKIIRASTIEELRR